MTKARNRYKPKSKLKTKPNLKNRLAKLVEPMPVDFVADLPLAECVTRLESRDKRDWWRSSKTHVTVTRVNNRSYVFQIRHMKNKYGRIIEAKGHLHKDGRSTRVEGEIISYSTLFPTMLFALVMLVGMYFLSNLNNCLLLPVIWATGATFYVFFDRPKFCHELAEMIGMTLGY